MATVWYKASLVTERYCVYNVQEVDERFLLVFPEDFVILAVGMSLSGYEMKVLAIL